MISLVIQAGGRSSRMGRDKGLVELAGKPLIEWVIGRIHDLGDETIITTNAPADYAYLGLRMAIDAEPGAGALPGLLTALQAARGEFALVVACDMPFLNHELLAHQIAIAPNADVVVPQWDDRYQTMHTVYRRDACLAAVSAALERGEKRMISFYGDLRVHAVPATTVARFDPEGHTFFNVNTPEDLALAALMVGEWESGVDSV